MAPQSLPRRGDIRHTFIEVIFRSKGAILEDVGLMERTSPTAESPNVTRAKIIATIGPASASMEAIAHFVEEGVNVFRINMSHCTHEVGICCTIFGCLDAAAFDTHIKQPLSALQFARKAIEDLRYYLASTNTAAEVAVWIDINGPKVRSGPLRDGKPVHLKAGDDFYVVNDENTLGDETKVATTYTRELLSIGDKIVIDDGMISLTVKERVEAGVRCTVDNNGGKLAMLAFLISSKSDWDWVLSGVLGEYKGINFPSHVLEDLPAVSEKDAEDLRFALEMGCDFISVSCIRNIHDVEEVRMLIGNSRIKVLSKIEVS